MACRIHSHPTVQRRVTLGGLMALSPVLFFLWAAHRQAVADGSLSRRADPDPLRFAEAIEEFTRADRRDGRTGAETVFVGSSSIRMWDLQQAFPGANYLNRGFGGAETSDILFYAEQVVFRYQPRTVVYFCGVNDLAAGKLADQVDRDFRQFVHRLHARCPQARLVVLAHKPSPARRNSLAELQRANELLRQLARRDPQVQIVEASYQAFIREDGEIRADLHVADGIHMSAAGYEIWREAVARALPEEGSRGKPER